jgi:hypothetical protein
MLERSGNIDHMNKLTSAKRAQVIATLVEGCSVNSTARLSGVSVPTILKLLRLRGLTPTAMFASLRVHAARP